VTGIKNPFLQKQGSWLGRVLAIAVF